MLKTGQNISQKQSLQQKLSPQQIQFVKMLQLPSIALEQRVKEEMEMNPVLEEAESLIEETVLDSEDEWSRTDEGDAKESKTDPVDQNNEIDWESFAQNTEYDGVNYSSGNYNEDWKDLPNPYYASFLEELEEQVNLLDLTEEELLIADQILGSLDEDGYFRRDINAVVDNIAFNHGILVDVGVVDRIRKKIQKLDPVGIASTDLRDCLICQVKHFDSVDYVKNNALKILDSEWDAFEKKHFEKLKNRLDLSDEDLKAAFDLIKGLNPRPGAISSPATEGQQYVEPDFEVYFEPDESESQNEGEFIIKLNQRNSPPLRISSEYREMWENLKKNKDDGETGQAKKFIKEKLESAQWFIDSIRQRQNTLMKIMKMIVSLQSDFFKYGEGLKPMILKDIADRIEMDISTVSRVVNGKYVQTYYGVYELKYFFSEGLETESGEDVSSREVKNLLRAIIEEEDKSKPLSDKALTEILKRRGYKVARRTVSKYRENLQIPVARLRKQII